MKVLSVFSLFYRPVAWVTLLILNFLSLGLAQAPPSTYVLGPGDQIALQLNPDGEEINGKLWRIDEMGTVSVPMIGTIQAAGLTTH